MWLLRHSYSAAIIVASMASAITPCSAETQLLEQISPIGYSVKAGTSVLHKADLGASTGGASYAMRLFAAKNQVAPAFGAFQILYDFSGNPDGASPHSPILVGNGQLFGTTQDAGAYGDGTVYELIPGPGGYTEKVVYSFEGSPDGNTPDAGLVADEAGNLYGTTTFGGSGCIGGRYGYCGVVFKLTPSASGYSESVIYSFQGPPDGEDPNSSLILDRSGALYGTTSLGGTSTCNGGCGTVFKLTPNGDTYDESVLYSFQNDGSDGVYPWAPLAFDKKGALWGTTSIGGAYSTGTVFKLSPSGSGYSESIIHSFGEVGSSDGNNPYAGVTIDKSGVVYGDTQAGGNPCNNTGIVGGCGIVFSITSKGSRYDYRILYTFAPTEGAQPLAPLVAESGGVLYGTTSLAGSNGRGVVFKLAPGKAGYVETSAYDFTGGADGAFPKSGLLQIRDGIYGTTSAGGSADCGGVFRIRI